MIIYSTLNTSIIHAYSIDDIRQSISMSISVDLMQRTLMRSLRETIHRASSRKKLITLFVVFKILATHTYMNYHYTIFEQNKSQV